MGEWPFIFRELGVGALPTIFGELCSTVKMWFWLLGVGVRVGRESPLFLSILLLNSILLASCDF